MIKYLLLTFVALIAIKASAQQYMLSGRITDGQGHAIPFTSVYIRNSTYGTTANESGNYQFKVDPGTYHLIYRFVGYTERIETVTITNQNVAHNVTMEPELFELKTVVIEGKRIKKDTAANTIMHRVIDKREYYLNEVKAYSCAVYIKGVQRLLGAPKMFMGKQVRNTLDLDSLGRGILYQSESISTFNFEQPNHIKEVTIASKTVGLNPAFSYNKASDLQVNFYKNLFSVPGLSNHSFV